MSEKREIPQSMGGSERDARPPRTEINAEEDDVYAQLAQKERDLILAAELGKALLDSNQELQSRYDQMLDEYTQKVEQLQQEKYDLHLELEKMETEYQNAIKDLQDDVAALRKQARTNDELQVSERERSRSLREAQQNSDYLLEQVKKASLREDELLKELDQLKIRNESNCATIKDHMDHISMLRDQVEYLSEKLRETNKKLQEIQVEKDILISTLEMTQESTQILEVKLSEQDVKIQRQASHIEELQESNSDLLQQLQQQQSSQHQLRTPFLGNRNNNSTRHNNSTSGNRQKSHNLFFEMNQKQKQSSFDPQPLTHPRVDKQQKQDQVTLASKQFDECDEAGQTRELTKTYKQSLFAELALGDSGESNPSPPLLAEFSSMCHHSRNTGDCSICCVTEGSRKRHHQNVGGGSDDDDDEASDSGPKQSLYSESHKSIYGSHGGSASSTMDSNGNQLSYLISSQFETRNACIPDSIEYSASSELTHRGKTNAMLHDNLSLSESESFPKNCLPHSNSQNSSKENTTFEDFPAQFEDTPYDSGKNNEKSLFSELSLYSHDFCPRQQDVHEQSLFTELSSQLYDDKTGTGSDSSSNCMLGVFDFSGSDAQDVDRNSNESLNRSMEIRSRIESDMSYVSDWYYMTPVTSEMLEEDDFECDDDDFLIGNMAGTTLSISGGDHGLRYHYHGYIPEEDITDQDCGTYDGDEISCNMQPESKGHNKQAQLTEACRQLKELVIRVQGEGCLSANKSLGSCGEFWEASTDILLSLVDEMRVCVDKMTAQKGEQVQSYDISTTVKGETAIAECNTEHQDKPEHSSHQQKHHRDVDSLTENGAGIRDETPKQIRKSKSSSSLV